MTKIILSAAALIATAGIASASLYGGYPVDVDAATLTDLQRLLIDNAVHGGGSSAEVVRAIEGIVNNG
jgi:hypothetical protein